MGGIGSGVKGHKTQKNKKIDLTNIAKTRKELKEILEKGGWEYDSKNGIWTSASDLSFGDSIHTKENQIYALSNTTEWSDKVQINFLEVNKVVRGKGYGIIAMVDIIRGSGSKKIVLTSADDRSDKFYNAIGMKKISGLQTNKYEGDIRWKREFLKSILKKQ